MSPEERARDVTAKLAIGCNFDVCPYDPCTCRQIIAAAIREAVAEKDAEIERLKEALRKIAAYDDHSAQKHLEKTGSYGAFDEPGSVGMAREALEWVCPIGNKDCKQNCGNYGCGN